jgi:NAD(P)H-dependent FMN reductase
MYDKRLNVGVIVGSTRDGRIGDRIGDWLVQRMHAENEVDLDVIDLKAISLPLHYPERLDLACERYLERLSQADAFVIITPEYNHGYPASLKQAIDIAHDEWFAKPIGFVSYGGVAGGTRAVEQLRQVFPELNAMTVRESVTLSNVNNGFDTSGNFNPSADCDRAVNRMMKQLIWWGHALRDARSVPAQETR